MPKLSIYLKLLTFLPVTFLYIFLGMLLVDKGSTDPCASTPAHDYITGIILLILFPFLAAGLLRLCLRGLSLRRRQKLLVYGVLPLACLILSTIFSIFALLSTESILTGSSLYSYFFEYKCYNDPEPKNEVCAAFISLGYYILMVAFFRITELHKTNK